MILSNLNEKDREKLAEYQKRMAAEKRCKQCICPWHDGLCSCGKSGQEQDEIARMVYAVL